MDRKSIECELAIPQDLMLDLVVDGQFTLVKDILTTLAQLVQLDMLIESIK